MCSNLAALENTVGNHGFLVTQPPYSKEGREAFIKKAIEILTNKNLWLEMSAKSREGAQNISWSDRWNDYWKKWVE